MLQEPRPFQHSVGLSLQIDSAVTGTMNSSSSLLAICNCSFSTCSFFEGTSLGSKRSRPIFLSHVSPLPPPLDLPRETHKTPVYQSSVVTALDSAVFSPLEQFQGMPASLYRGRVRSSRRRSCCCRSRGRHRHMLWLLWYGVLYSTWPCLSFIHSCDDGTRIKERDLSISSPNYRSGRV
jgi:hypothetical protein